MSASKKKKPEYVGEEVADDVKVEETDEEFDRREAIARDMYKGPIVKVTCPTCGKEFDTEEEMEKHALKSHGRK
jgi:hypothetical protein